MKPEAGIQKCRESSIEQEVNLNEPSNVLKERTVKENNIIHIKSKDDNLIIPSESPKKLSTIPSEVIYSILSTSVDTQEFRKPTTFSLRFKEDVEIDENGNHSSLPSKVDIDAETENPIPDENETSDTKQMVQNDKPKEKSKKTLSRFCCVKWSNILNWNSGIKYKKLTNQSTDIDKY